MPTIHFQTVSEVQGATPGKGFLSPTVDDAAPDLIRNGQRTRIAYREYLGQPALWWLYNDDWSPIGTVRVQMPRHDDVTRLHHDVRAVLGYLERQAQTNAGGGQPSRYFEHQGFGRYREADAVCTLTTRGGSQRDNGLIVCC